MLKTLTVAAGALLALVSVASAAPYHHHVRHSGVPYGYGAPYPAEVYGGFYPRDYEWYPNNGTGAAEHFQDQFHNE